MDSEQLEKYSSAVTLSDMEIFVFPELMYSLVLANIMSPVIWSWRDDNCFKKLEGKSSYKKFMRLKQYIMDEFDFNLDLETWGLTSQDKELKRFEKFISAELVSVYPFLSQQFLQHHLRGDTGMVNPRQPQCRLALHPMPAGHNIFQSGS